MSAASWDTLDEVDASLLSLVVGWRLELERVCLIGSPFRGVIVREFHTPSTSGSSIKARMPKGISLLDLAARIISPLSACSSAALFS